MTNKHCELNFYIMGETNNLKIQHFPCAFVRFFKIKFAETVDSRNIITCLKQNNETIEQRNYITSKSVTTYKIKTAAKNWNRQTETLSNWKFCHNENIIYRSKIIILTEVKNYTEWMEKVLNIKIFHKKGNRYKTF